MFYIIYFRLLYKVLNFLFNLKINIKIITLLGIVLYILSITLFTFYNYIGYYYPINIIEYMDTLNYSLNLIEDNNLNESFKLIKEENINPYNKLYGIFNFNKPRLNVPIIQLHNSSFDNSINNLMNLTNSNNDTYKDILKLADYRYTSLRHDIFNIINDSLKSIS